MSDTASMTELKYILQHLKKKKSSLPNDSSRKSPLQTQFKSFPFVTASDQYPGHHLFAQWCPILNQNSSWISDPGVSEAKWTK